MTDDISKVVKFLLGEGELRGAWFGDEPPGALGPMPRFWWRKDLRAAFARLESATTPAEVGDDMLPDALVPHAKEWYQLCERRFAVDRMNISGPMAEAIVTAIGDLARQLAEAKAENERLQKAMKVQANAVETLRSADRAIAAHDRAAAERLNASCKPEMVDSEKAANAMLTDALEQAESQLAEATRRLGEVDRAARQLRFDYVRMLETARDRIHDLGGECDPVDVMERADPALRAFDAALQKEPTK